LNAPEILLNAVECPRNLLNAPEYLLNAVECC
jgi:hypothetical protein